MNKLIPLLALLFLFLGTSCKKDNLVDYNADFLGEWHTDTFYSPTMGADVEMYFLIEDGYCEYGWFCDVSCLHCDCFKFAAGKIKINQKRTKIWAGDLKNEKTWLKMIATHLFSYHYLQFY